ncbi:MAG: VWA domain-containing protein [Bacteroidales bacterium]|nr:VWA domain-containing protein [Bacteroidales bacterium]
MLRRLPVYLLVDTSSSMKGEPIESVKVGIESMIATLSQDPYALERVNISIITYDREVKVLLPLTPLKDLQLPNIITPDSGPTHTGAALEMLLEIVNQEVNRGCPEHAGDYRPFLFLMTDGKLSDTQLFNSVVYRVKSKFATIVCFTSGTKVKIDCLELLSDKVYPIDNLDSVNFKKLFTWPSGFPGEYGINHSLCELILPPPLEEMDIII